MPSITSRLSQTIKSRTFFQFPKLSWQLSTWQVTEDNEWKTPSTSNDCLHELIARDFKCVSPSLGLNNPQNFIFPHMWILREQIKERNREKIAHIQREKGEIPRFTGRPTPIPTPQPKPKPVNTWKTLKVKGFSIRIPSKGLLWLATTMLLLLLKPLPLSIPQQPSLFAKSMWVNKFLSIFKQRIFYLSSLIALKPFALSAKTPTQKIKN